MPSGSPRERELRPFGERGRVRAPSSACAPPARAFADARAPGTRGHGRCRRGRAAVGATRPSGSRSPGFRVPTHAGVLVSPGAGREARSGSADPAHLLGAGFAARRQGADSRPVRARPLDEPGRPHAPLPARRQRRALQLRPRRPSAVGGRGHERPRRAGRANDAASRLDGRARVVPAPAAAARAGGLPAARLDAGGADVAHTRRGELAAAVDPPLGTSAWRYPNTPHELQALWKPGRAERDHTRRRDDVPGRAPPRRRRDRRPGGLARAARRRRRRQAPHRRLQLRLRPPKRCRSS